MKTFLKKIQDKVDDILETVVESVENEEEEGVWYDPYKLQESLKPIIYIFDPLYPSYKESESIDSTKNLDWLEKKFRFLASNNVRNFRRVLFQTTISTFIGYKTAIRLRNNSNTANGFFFTLLIIMYATIKTDILTPINYRQSVRKLIQQFSLHPTYKVLIKHWAFWTYDTITSLLRFLFNNVPTTFGMAIGTLIAQQQRLKQDRQ